MFRGKRAVEKAYEVAESTQGPVYTYGPIIHNEEVVRDLEERGVRVLESEEDLKNWNPVRSSSVLMVFLPVFTNYWNRKILPTWM